MAGHEPRAEPWPPEAWLQVEAGGRTALVGGWSATSGRAHFPPGLLCPWTGADDVEHRILPRTGTLFAWTAVTAALASRGIAPGAIQITWRPDPADTSIHRDGPGLQEIAKLRVGG